MKKKLILIIGIVVMVGGLAAILYPIINQAVIASQQRKLMAQVKEDILNNIAANAGDNDSKNDPTPTPVIGDVAQGSENPAGVEGINLEASFSNLTETDNPGQENYDQSKLRWQKCIGVITIEKIDIVYAVVEGTEDNNIFYAIGHFPDSVGIGQEGNCALAGHSGGTNGKFFQDLKDLEKGDPVVLTDLDGYEYTYIIEDIFVVNPEDVYVVKDLGKPGKYLTMVTCTSRGNKRLIARAVCTEEPVRIREFKE